MEISLKESPELVQELADHISITTLPLAIIEPAGLQPNVH
jgi:hypothetical protein